MASANKLDVVLTGGRGLIGGALCSLLDGEGHRVRHVTRNPREDGDIGWDPQAGTLDAAALEGADAVVHLAGENVAQRWNEGAKTRILESRVKGTTLLAEALAGLTKKPKVLISASAIGFYGDSGTDLVDESAPRGEGFLAEVCEAWEAAAEPARAAGIRVVHPRIGVVMAKEGGALAKMLLPFKMGVGGRVGSGEQFMSWVHIDDVAAAMMVAIHGDEEGPLNLVSPNPVTNAVFTKALGEALGRPTFMPLPRFAAKLALGSEMADEMLLVSQRVRPAALEAGGFEFAFAEIGEALKALV